MDIARDFVTIRPILVNAKYADQMAEAYGLIYDAEIAKGKESAFRAQPGQTYLQRLYPIMRHECAPGFEDKDKFCDDMLLLWTWAHDIRDQKEKPEAFMALKASLEARQGQHLDVAAFATVEDAANGWWGPTDAVS